ncbi:MAG: SUMF1/EgtB/PvdO family nonheme iron enzyme [Acidobacteriia bacterium]|nr:SUMF1/EgtB/PvdO family nonheme iron enzyme [Terriglobia bacterium]
MSAAAPTLDVRPKILTRLAEARASTDELFRLVHPAALYERPIPERHRIVFYIGHLETFDWNLIGQHALGLGQADKSLDRLFAFGIDPVNGTLPSDQPTDWPSEEEVRRYSQCARRQVDAALQKASFADSEFPLLLDGYLLHVAIEHRLMHAETLTYMLQRLPFHQKRIPPAKKTVSASAVRPGMVEIPGGMATLGMHRGRGHPFGCDNEFQRLAVRVPPFRIDVYNVTNGEFLEFIRCGAYEDCSFWASADWEWKASAEIHHPLFWNKTADGWIFRTIFAEVPLPLQWPAYVSHAEASAYARWKGKSLPTEAQWHRAAVGTPEGVERSYPWGNDLPAPQHGNFNFQSWDPAPVGTSPGGNSAFGVADLMGNGWEWTRTLFEPLPGFERFSFYPGYSADFFDGKHFVLKGASPRTAMCMLRRSFRNWFQPQYPYAYASFRCVEN